MPHRGLVAGGSTATFEAKVFVFPPMQDTGVPGASQVIHIDDLAMRSIDAVAWNCVQALSTLATAMKAAFDALMIPLAYPKIALVGSSPALVRKGQAVLQELAGEAKWSAPNLGIDFTSGKHSMGSGAREVRRARWAKADGRVRKIDRLKASQPDCPLPKSRFFNVSVWTGLAYGGEVQGFSPAEIFGIRCMAYRVSSFKVRGANSHLLLVISPTEDPLHASHRRSEALC